MNYRLFAGTTLAFLASFSAQIVPHSAGSQIGRISELSVAADHEDYSGTQAGLEHLKRSSFRPDRTARINTYRLSDGDVIMITVEKDRGIAADQIEIVLNTDPNVTWWKSIIVKEPTTKPDGSYGGDRTVNSISTQDDDHGPKAMRLNLAEVTDIGSMLVFAKGKFLGVHTEMYQYDFGRDNPDYLDDLKGKRLIFTWQKD